MGGQLCSRARRSLVRCFVLRVVAQAERERQNKFKDHPAFAIHSAAKGGGCLVAGRQEMSRIIERYRTIRFPGSFSLPGGRRPPPSGLFTPSSLRPAVVDLVDGEWYLNPPGCERSICAPDVFPCSQIASHRRPQGACRFAAPVISCLPSATTCFFAALFLPRFFFCSGSAACSSPR